MSLLWYRATILNIPTRFIKQINILFRSFMWNNRMQLIRQEVLESPTMKGGIDLVNITTKVKALRIKHILDPIFDKKNTLNGKLWHVIGLAFASKPRMISNNILIGEVHLRKLPISFTKNALNCLNKSLKLLKH